MADRLVGDSDKVRLGNNLSETTNLILDASLRPLTKEKYNAQCYGSNNFALQTLDFT